MLDRVLLDLDPYFLSWISWSYVMILVVSLWGIAKGRSACYLVALAAVFMFIESTSVVITANVLIQREFASEAETLGVCSEFKDVDAKKVENSLGDLFSGEIKPFNFEYQDCVEQWVNENDPRMQWLHLLSFIFRVVSELLRASAFLSVLAMLKDSRIINTRGVIRWYKEKASHNG
ncbi:hypothetical protein [Aeromonas rivipollensis]|uniref:hypothetical protein n=1 Tax=Aeromonas rivipollensis TaxID=948519 RepID=UPI0038CF7014